MEILVYGAGGHGRVVADILLTSNQMVTGFLDDNQELHGSTVLDLPVLGGEAWLRHERAKEKVVLALGIGHNGIRQRLAERCAGLNVELAVCIHPSAAVSRSSLLGHGTVVMAGAVVNSGARIGAGVIVNSGAVIEHDVTLGDYAHVSPNAAMGGASSLGTLSHLGLGAVVLPGVSVGSRSVVGAGAVVTQPIPDQVVAVGVPARVQRKI